MHMSKVLRPMNNASIHMMMSANGIILHVGKAKATLGASAHTTGI